MELVDRFNAILKRISAALDLTSGGVTADVVLALREELTALRKDLLAAQNSALELDEKNAELREQLRQAHRFASEMERYAPMTLESGAVVYVEKEAAEGGAKPKAYLCAHCFEAGKKRYLSPPGKREFHFDVFTCSVCGYQAPVPNDHEPAVLTTTHKRRDWDDYI